MIVNTNQSSLFTRRTLAGQAPKQSVIYERLASGLRINSAADDAAGLAISERMTTQVNGSSQAKRNVNDGISVAQTAEGALGNVSDLLQRIRQLTLQSLNGSNSSADRTSLQEEVEQLVYEFDRVASQTEFNGQKLLDGSLLTSRLHVGANRSQSIMMGVQSTKAADLYNYALSSDVLTASAMSAAQTATSDGSINQRNRLQAQNLTVNARGQVGTAVLQAGVSAREVAARINNAVVEKKGLIGARAETYAFIAFGSGATLGNGAAALTQQAALDFKLNGVSIQAASSSLATDLDDVVTAINSASGATGVTAQKVDLPGSTGNYRIQLFASDGRDISISEANVSTQTGGLAGGASLMQVQGAYDSGSKGNVIAVGAVASGSVGNSSGVIALGSGGATASRNTTVGGRVLLSNDAAFTLSHNATGSTGGLLGFPPSSIVACTKGNTLFDLDVSTSSGAGRALDVVDSVLGRINSYRGALGSVQTRLDFTSGNLAQSVEVTSAARSRVRDADFAEETSALLRMQVVQQAGTAMLSQANQRPQQALQLLQ